MIIVQVIMLFAALLGGISKLEAIMSPMCLIVSRAFAGLHCGKYLVGIFSLTYISSDVHGQSLFLYIRDYVLESFCLLSSPSDLHCPVHLLLRLQNTESQLTFDKTC